MDATQDRSQDTSQDTAEDASYAALVEALRDQVSYLKALIQTRDRELEARTEELTPQGPHHRSPYRTHPRA